MAEQCKGKTQKGEQCKNVTKSETGLCHRHQLKTKPKATTTPKVMVWEKEKFPVPDESVDKRHLRMIETLEKGGPAKKDKPGYVYIFYLSTETEAFFKIGKTSRTVTKRLTEWRRKIGDGVKLFESFRVSCNSFCERLIHLYLDPWRVYRYKVTENEYCSVWKKDGKAVTDADAKLKKLHRLNAKSKEIEWFHFKGDTDEYMLDIVQTICKKYRHIPK